MSTEATAESGADSTATKKAGGKKATAKKKKISLEDLSDEAIDALEQRLLARMMPKGTDGANSPLTPEAILHQMAKSQVKTFNEANPKVEGTKYMLRAGKKLIAVTERKLGAKYYSYVGNIQNKKHTHAKAIYEREKKAGTLLVG